jgi:hypothetical protein
MGKAAATLGLGPAARLEAGIDERRGQVLPALKLRRSRIAAAWHHRCDLERQRADLFKSADAALGRDTGCRC